MKSPWQKFRAHRRGWWSLWIFSFVLLVVSCSNLICNNKPLCIFYEGKFFFPILKYYPETDFGGRFDLEMEYTAPLFKEILQAKRGWALWPLFPYSVNTVNMNVDTPAPSPPSLENILGTDDQGRDVFTRLLYGLRVSLYFGLTLAFLSSLLGIAAGAVQGYYGGWVDLLFQRIIEIWSSIPSLFVMMIFSSLVHPSVGWLLIIMVFFSWTDLVSVVRAEFLRARHYTYVRAAHVMGVPSLLIMGRHILPNAMTSALSAFPFLVSSAISTLTALDFLGFGLPPGSASLGELLQQAKSNLFAPWLGLSAFLAIAFILVLVAFIGEGLRDAFDPRTYT